MVIEPRSDVVILQVLSGRDVDADQLDDLTAMLRDEILMLDVASVEPMMQNRPPEDAKGPVAALGGWLAVHLGPASLKAVVKAVVGWAGRNGKTVELTLNGNTLKVTGASSDVQAKIVDEFFARLSPSA
jgi:hypothetical protein